MKAQAWQVIGSIDSPITGGDGNDTFQISGGVNEITGGLTINNGIGDGATILGKAAADTTTVDAFQVSSSVVTNGFGGAHEYRRRAASCLTPLRP